MKNFWKDKKVVVTGGDGFIGSHLVEILYSYGAKIKLFVRNKELKKIPLQIQRQIEITQVDLNNKKEIESNITDEKIVINLAAKVGGIEYNMNHPASIFRDNILSFINLIDNYRNKNLERFCIVSSACVYPRHCSIPTPESEGFIDLPEPTNIGYGWSKRTEELLGDWYNKEYGMNISIVRPYNAYGPRDNFNPESSHVIPALIRRVFSGENPLKVWGSGNQTRSFLFVKDFARGVLEVCEKNTQPNAINLGTDEETKIKDLIYLILKISKVDKKIIFDTTKAEGQPRRNCDTTLLKKVVGFKTEYDIEKGLEETIEFYKKNYLKNE
ncbi:MAG: NAD-dependent epimerase/dehydratase [Candidatus Roizmanbacteria bacterium GW2011_GWC2_35_12]|uniref:NAD-dependent epimerase/dehydratase n=1 Tax=Candidatus Roizmanbacteria bacterium GW2011_GWC2_35_12 TaxID=1618485 RepID=A0A0G0BBG9_9BACT|nr:MAG: NAD-dependent epimerase/dehydratase [Candidatus Roizmanbacteria bacterium GW2011_GWC2_35_12]